MLCSVAVSGVTWQTVYDLRRKKTPAPASKEVALQSPLFAGLEGLMGAATRPSPPLGHPTRPATRPGTPTDPSYLPCLPACAFLSGWVRHTASRTLRGASAVLVLLQRLYVCRASQSAIPSNILYILSDILLPPPHNILRTPSKILCTLSNILCQPDDGRMMFPRQNSTFPI